MPSRLAPRTLPVVLIVLLAAGCGQGNVLNPGPGGTARGYAAFVPGSRVHVMPPPNPNGLTGTPATTQLKYYGGHVISNVKVVVVFWGSGVDTTVQGQMPPFYKAFTKSSIFDWLDEYDTNVTSVSGSQGTNQVIGHGSYLKTVTIKPAASGTALTNKQIQGELNGQIDAGNLPAPDANTIYMVYFPKGIDITSGTSKACTDFCAYHGTFTRAGQSVFYAVMPSLATGTPCGTSCRYTTSMLGSLTWASSHELVEAVTDAEVGLAATVGPPLAWYDLNHGEIGDICYTQGATFTDAAGTVWQIQKEWSNQAQSCITQKDAGGPASDFGIALSGTSVSLAAGASTSLNVTTTATGTPEVVALSVAGLPSGVTGTFSPTSVTAGQTATLTLAATAGAATVSGATFTVTGTAKSGAHTASGTVAVTASGGPGSTGTLQNGVPLSGLSGAASSSSRYTLAVPTGSSNLTFTLSGGTGDADLYVKLGSDPTLSSYDCHSAVHGNNETCTVASPGAGTWHVLVYGNAAYASVTLTGSYTAGGTGGNFALSVSSSSVSAAQGGTGQITVHTAPTTGTPPQVTFSVTSLPAGVTGSFAPASVVAGKDSVLTLTVAGTAATTSGVSFRVYGKAQGHTHYRTISLSITPAGTTGGGTTGNFTMTLSSASAQVAPGSTTSLTVHTSGASGSTPSIFLHVTGLPTGVTASLSPSTVTAGGDAVLTLSASSSAPAVTSDGFRVYGKSGSYLHYRAASVTVSSAPPTGAGDFGMTVSPTSLTIHRGSWTALTVSTTTVSGGGTPTVALHIPTLPAGVTASFNPASVSAGGSAGVTLTVSASAATVTGATFRVYGQSTDHTHYRVVTLTVQ